MSAVVEKKTRPEDVLRAQLNAMDTQLVAALPSHINPEKFKRVVMTVVQLQPDLIAADRRSLLASCMKCASDGLIPDGREAALVIFNTKVKRDGKEEWIKAVQYLPMLNGVLKRLRNSGQIIKIAANIVHENDVFEWIEGTEEMLRHVPTWKSEPGRVLGAYAIATLKDGTKQWRVLPVSELDKIANVSRSKDKQGNPYGPWLDWREEMYLKSAIRRLSKWLPMDAETQDFVNRSVEAPTIDAQPETSQGVNMLAQNSDVSGLEAPTNRLDALEMGLDIPDAEVVPASEKVDMERRA
jgi:recombination protein RecT